MDEWDSLSVNLAFWDMCEYLYRQFSTVWFGPNSGLSRMTLFGQFLPVIVYFRSATLSDKLLAQQQRRIQRLVGCNALLMFILRLSQVFD